MKETFLRNGEYFLFLTIWLLFLWPKHCQVIHHPDTWTQEKANMTVCTGQNATFRFTLFDSVKEDINISHITKEGDEIITLLLAKHGNVDQTDDRVAVNDSHSIVLMNVTIADSGLYEHSVFFGNGSQAHAHLYMTVHPEGHSSCHITNSTEGPERSNVEQGNHVSILISVFVSLAVLLVVVLIILYFKHCRKSEVPNIHNNNQGEELKPMIENQHVHSKDNKSSIPNRNADVERPSFDPQICIVCLGWCSDPTSPELKCVHRCCSSRCLNTIKQNFIVQCLLCKVETKFPDTVSSQREEGCKYENGVISYTGTNNGAGYAHFIGTTEIAHDTSFTIETSGKYIAVGLVHECYNYDAPPGWHEGSIGYHGDGFLYHNSTQGLGPKIECAEFNERDKITCKVRLARGGGVVIFMRNSKEVFRRNINVVLPWFPMISLHHENDSCRLVDTEAWEDNKQTHANVDNVQWERLSTKICRYCKWDKQLGIVEFEGQRGDLGHFIGEMKMVPPQSFTIVITGEGNEGNIQIGLTPTPTEGNRLSGLGEHSYAARTGRIKFNGDLYEEDTDHMICNAGDVMICSLYMQNDQCKVSFSKKLRMDSGLQTITSTIDGWGPQTHVLYPMIRLESDGAKVRLLDDNVWINQY